jgi:predicted acyltransferase
VVFSWASILRRAALLFFIGVALSLAIRPTLDPDMIRWTGVLQRIAIVYVICAAVIAVRRGGILLPMVLALGLLAVQSWLLLAVGTPDGGPPSLEPGMGISGWLDQHFIPGRVHRETWEPEGILSTLGAAANGLIGVAVMRWVQKQAPSNYLLGIAAAVLLAAGYALTPWLPLNKNLWTASFALLTSGAGILFWTCLRALWPKMGGNATARWTVGLGQAALTLYVIHMLLIAVIFRELPSGQRIWQVTYDALAATGLHPGIASMLYAMIAAAISCAILVPLQRRGWLLKV